MCTSSTDKAELKLKEAAMAIFRAGIGAVDPALCIRKCVSKKREEMLIRDVHIPLKKIRRVYVLGIGKASAAMAAEVETILGPRIHSGLIITKYGHGCPLKYCRVVEAGHPVPDSNGVKGAQALIDLVSTAGPEDLVLCLISGGGSALSPAPVPGISLEHKQEVTRLLLECGATIHEINAIRKHLSRLKGGQLCRYVQKARVVSLILSDVIGDDLDIISSGITVSDPDTFDHCRQILEEYGLMQSLPPAVRDHLAKGCSGQVQETPKPGDPIFDNTWNIIVGSLDDALSAAEDKACSLSFHPLRLTSMLQGEAREAAKFLCSIAKEVHRSKRPIPCPACLLSGGETTVTIKGNGLGGRNMELALASSLELSGLPYTVLLSAGTDGTDGPTNAAGAFAAGSTEFRAKNRGLSPKQYMSRNDSYNFFKEINDLFITGPTGTNVMDMQIMLVGQVYSSI